MSDSWVRMWFTAYSANGEITEVDARRCDAKRGFYEIRNVVRMFQSGKDVYEHRDAAVIDANKRRQNRIRVMKKEVRRIQKLIDMEGLRSQGNSEEQIRQIYAD